MTSTTGGGGGIRKVDLNKGFGTITPDDGGKGIRFEFSVVEGGAIPRAGQRVEYQAEMKGSALTTTKVTLSTRR